MLKVGILGMGTMGWVHAKRYLRVPNTELVAICDANPKRLEAKEVVQGNLGEGKKASDMAQIARYADAAQFIAQSDLDLIDICLPSFLHPQYAIEALQAGKHVLCEKPMALTVPECDQMIKVARKADRLLMVAQCIRFWPEYVFLRKHVQQETFGKLLSLNMYRIGGMPLWSWDNWFRDTARSGGPPFDLHIHDVDFVNYMLGLPDRIQVAARASEASHSQDVIHALFSYDDGPQVHMHAGWSVAQIPFQAGYDAWFERGFIRYHGGDLQVFDNLNKVEKKDAEYERGDAYHNEIAYLANCIEMGTPPTECMPESARDSVALIGKEIAAAQSGQTINGKE